MRIVALVAFLVISLGLEAGAECSSQNDLYLDVGFKNEILTYELSNQGEVEFSFYRSLGQEDLDIFLIDLTDQKIIPLIPHQPLGNKRPYVDTLKPGGTYRESVYLNIGDPEKYYEHEFRLFWSVELIHSCQGAPPAIKKFGGSLDLLFSTDYKFRSFEPVVDDLVKNLFGYKEK